MPLAVELRGVSFGYRPGQRVLEDVDLALGEGEFVAVAGPNGAGKTTLMRIVLGLERPSEIWTYNNLDIPGFPASFDFEFVDFNGTGDFELVQDIDTAAPMWNQFGTVNNALDAIAQRRQVIGEVDPSTGRDRFNDVDGTRMVMREFDLQQRVQDVLNTPERTLPPLRTEVAARAAFGNCPSGYTNVATDCNDALGSIRPMAPELCNGTDDDCDTMVDDGVVATGCYADADGDGYGAGASSTRLARRTARS